MTKRGGRRKGAGRHKGAIVRLMNDPGRFEIAACLAFARFGLHPYPAARLAIFLLAMEGPVTTESIGDALLMSWSEGRWADVASGEDGLRRKSALAQERANATERLWLEASVGGIVALVHAILKGDAATIALTCDLLRAAGWSEPLNRVGERFDAVTKSNFPPAHPDHQLSRAARGVLRRLASTV
jgi:hypothetical protein